MLENYNSTSWKTYSNPKSAISAPVPLLEYLLHGEAISVSSTQAVH